MEFYQKPLFDWLDLGFLLVAAVAFWVGYFIGKKGRPKRFWFVGDPLGKGYICSYQRLTAEEKEQSKQDFKIKMEEIEK